jgi:hypothetical protein
MALIDAGISLCRVNSNPPLQTWQHGLNLHSTIAISLLIPEFAPIKYEFACVCQDPIAPRQGNVKVNSKPVAFVKFTTQ